MKGKRVIVEGAENCKGDKEMQKLKKLLEYMEKKNEGIDEILKNKI